MPHAPGIELRHLRYFLAVYEELHFGRAAARLHIAQPPLSQAIRKLEQELDVQLFVRTSRAVNPTPAGTALAAEARKVLAAFEFAVLETKRAGAAALTLRVGCVTFLPTSRLQRFLAALKRSDGELRTEVAHLWGLEQVDRLRAGQLDLGVLLNVEDYPELDYEPLYPGEEIYAFVPSDHVLARRRVIEPEDVAAETQVSLPRAVNPVFYDRYMQLFAEAGYHFRHVQELNSNDPRDALLAVGDGLGIAFGPASLPEIGDEGKRVVGVRLDPALRLPDVVVAWRTNPPRRVHELLPVIRESARELYRSQAAA